MVNKSNYNVRTAGWTMDVYVDEELFDDPHVEACTLSIESKDRKSTRLNSSHRT